jgi:hypothetical protein
MTATIDISAVDTPVIVIIRDFVAPRELVWKATRTPRGRGVLQREDNG